MLLQRLKYSNKIRVLFVPVFLVFAVGLVIIYTKVTQNLTERHEERLERTADLTLRNLDLTAQEMKKLANLFRANRTLVEYLYIVNVLGGSKSVLGDFLAPYSRVLDIDFIRLYDERGRSVYDFDEGPNSKVGHYLGKDLPEDTIYGFSEIGGQVEIVSIAPLFADQGGKGRQKIVGFIAVGKHVSGEYLQEIKEVSGNEILLVRDSKILVSSLDRDKIFLPSAGKATIGDQTYSIRGMPVQDLYGTSLISLTVAISDGPLVESIGSLRKYMSLVLISAFMLFLGLSLIFEKVLVTPLKEIIRFITRIAAGRFDGRLILTSRDEVSILAEHLLAMQEELKAGHDLVNQYTAELQKAVDERTQELKNTQEKLLLSQRMEVLGQLTSGVAHEVRNPLNAIMALTDAIDLDTGDNKELKPYITHMRTQVYRLSALMNELLDLGKPIDPSQLKPVLLKELCALAIGVWKQTRLGKQLSVDLSVAPSAEECTILAYEEKFQQVMINLLDNAAQHSPQGNIELKITAEEERCFVSLIDRGTGIPPESLPRVFETFFTTRRGGTGLGLGIAKNIVEMHGGEIRVFNNDPLPGCTFEIVFPVYAEAAK